MLVWRTEVGGRDAVVRGLWTAAKYGRDGAQAYQDGSVVEQHSD